MNTIEVQKPTYLPWLIDKINKCTKKKNQNDKDIDKLLNALYGEPEFRNFYRFVLEYCNVHNLTDTVKKKDCFDKMGEENWIKQNDVSIL